MYNILCITYTQCITYLCITYIVVKYFSMCVPVFWCPRDFCNSGIWPLLKGKIRDFRPKFNKLDKTRKNEFDCLLTIPGPFYDFIHMHTWFRRSGAFQPSRWGGSEEGDILSVLKYVNINTGMCEHYYHLSVSISVSCQHELSTSQSATTCSANEPGFLFSLFKSSEFSHFQKLNVAHPNRAK